MSVIYGAALVLFINSLRMLFDIRDIRMISINNHIIVLTINIPRQIACHARLCTVAP